MKFLGNLLWFILVGFIGWIIYIAAGILWCISIVGIELAVFYLAAGCLLCITIIGIPFGFQCFKLAKVSFLPFGTTFEKK